jgi:hypothetical protein
MVEKSNFNALGSKAKPRRFEGIVSVFSEMFQMVIDCDERQRPPHGMTSKSPDMFRMAAGTFVVANVAYLGANVAKSRREDQPRISIGGVNGVVPFPRERNPDYNCRH